MAVSIMVILRRTPGNPRLMLLVAATVCLITSGALAQTLQKIRYGYSGGADTAAAWIAKDQGFFAKRGLDVEMTQLSNSALFPPALQSGSLDIATPTTPLVLQANDGGLDLIIISGGSVALRTSKGMAVLSRTDLALHTAKDFVGHKVGVPGLGGFLDILFREWLRRQGVAPEKVEYVELSQGVMADTLRTGSIDAVVVSDPIATRIQQQKAGVAAAYITEDLPDGLPVIVYAANRSWVEGNLAAAHEFAAAIGEATNYAASHPETLRSVIGKYLGIKPDIAEAMSLPALRSTITADDLGLWMPILKGQGVVQGALDTNKIILR